MTHRPLGVGIVGLSANGGWGARAHLPALRALDGFEVRGLSASDKDTAALAGERFGVPLAVADPAVLAQDEAIDIVAICVRVPHHAELVGACLDAGKTVYCEWPLARSAAEARDLADAAARAGVRTAVGLQARHTPAVRYVRDLIADDAIGEVLSTTLVGSGGGWADTTTTRTAYTLDRANGATMLTIPFGHTLDALVHVLGPVRDLTATATVVRPWATDSDTGEQVAKTAHDQVAVTGTLHSGAVLSAHYRAGSSPGTAFHWEINGTHGDIVLRGPTGHLQFGQVEVMLGRTGAGLAPVALPDSYRSTPASLGESGGPASVARAYLMLAQDLRRGTSHVPDFAHGVAHHELLEAIERAAETGVRVTP